MKTRHARAAVACTLALTVAVTPRIARAQQALLGGSIVAASGLEIGDGGGRPTAWRLARTRVAAAFDWRNDEDRRTIFMGQLFAELEPQTSVGIELRYGRSFGAAFEGFIGASATLAPATLFGPVIAGRYYPLGMKSEWALFVEPSLSVLPFGTDLPSSKAIVWSLLTIGARVDLSPSTEP